MTNSVVFKFQGSSKTTKGENDEELTVYSAIASTDALDRDKEVLLPKGALVENFMENPVMLSIHNYGKLTVGKVLSLEISNKDITFDFVFAPTQEGKDFESMYKTGFMNAFSVGLYPQKSLWIDDETPKKFEVEIADGKKQQIDLNDWKETPRRIVNQWELLEISPVPVPANPEALLQRAADQIVRKFVDTKTMSKAAQQLLEHQLDAKMAPIAASIETFLKGLDTETLKDTIAPETTPVQEVAWDASDAQARLASWASEDNSGDKDSIDWGKFAEGHASVDLESADKFSSYSYLHHTVRDGELIAVWKGITTAMSNLLKSKSDMDEEHVKAIYDHLAQHYKDFNKEAPELDKDYTAEELELVSEGKELIVEADESEGNESTDDKGGDQGSDDVSEQLKSIKAIQDAILELEETLRLRLNIFSIKLDETIDGQKALEAHLKESKSTDDVTDLDDTDSDEDVDKGLEDLNGILTEFQTFQKQA